MVGKAGDVKLNTEGTPCKYLVLVLVNTAQAANRLKGERAAGGL